MIWRFGEPNQSKSANHQIKKAAEGLSLGGFGRLTIHRPDRADARQLGGASAAGVNGQGQHAQAGEGVGGRLGDTDRLHQHARAEVEVDELARPGVAAARERQGDVAVGPARRVDADEVRQRGRKVAARRSRSTIGDQRAAWASLTRSKNTVKSPLGSPWKLLMLIDPSKRWASHRQTSAAAKRSTAPRRASSRPRRGV